MSLINDALKRAKAAQPSAPPPLSQGPQLRPVEPRPTAQPSFGLVAVGILGVAGLLAFLLAWQIFRRAPASATDEPGLLAQARSQQPLAPAPVELAPETSVETSPASFGPTDLPVPLAPAPLPTPPALPALPAGASPAASDAAGLAATNNPAPVPAGPPPLKLQGVISHPTRPSAIISGKTVFIGDAVGDATVTALTSRTATLKGPNGTQVLSLSE